MTPGETDADAGLLDDPAAELRLVVQELTEARAEADELRRDIGDPASEPGDQAARANLITSLEMQAALIESLEARAAVLRQRLSKT
jgi:hypothetical protein